MNDKFKSILLGLMMLFALFAKVDFAQQARDFSKENARSSQEWVKDAIIYTTFAPCLQCAKMVINAGLREVVYNQEYPLNDSAFRLFQEAGVFIRRLKVE